MWLDPRVEIQTRMRQEAHDPNGERTRLPRSIVTRTNRVKWQPKCGPRGNRCRMGMDQGNSWTTKTRIGGIQGRRYGGPGDSGDNVVDQEDQVHASKDRMAKVRACADLEGEDSCNTDLKSKGSRKRGPEGQRSAQARAGKIKVWARESQSATKVFRATGESNRGGRIESRGPPEANRGERKQRMMDQ